MGRAGLWRWLLPTDPVTESAPRLGSPDLDQTLGVCPVRIAHSEHLQLR